MNMTMMSTKKGRAWFVPGLVVLPVLLFYLSFFRGEEMGSSPGRQLELQTFQSGDGWGYQIRMNGKVLSDYHNSLNELGKTTVDELCHYKGIGPAKAITILAASELGKRRKEEEGKERKVILSSRDVYQYFYPLMCDLPTEECRILSRGLFTVE